MVLSYPKLTCFDPNTAFHFRKLDDLNYLTSRINYKDKVTFFAEIV